MIKITFVFCKVAIEEISSTALCFRYSHFHLDHCGALPYMSEMVGFDGKIFMTHPTKAICPIMLVSYLFTTTDFSFRYTNVLVENIDICCFCDKLIVIVNALLFLCDYLLPGTVFFCRGVYLYGQLNFSALCSRNVKIRLFLNFVYVPDRRTHVTKSKAFTHSSYRSYYL